MHLSSPMRPWCAASLVLALSACGGEGSLEPSNPAPAARAIASESGNDQEAKAGERLREPFVVRVTDARGEGVAGVDVTWGEASGTGWLLGRRLNHRRRGSIVEATDSDGLSAIYLQPTAVGTSTVTAAVAALEGSPVTFTAPGSVVVIEFVPDPIDGPWFSGPTGSGHVTVPVGTTVEWAVRWICCLSETARIASSSEPPRGKPFDSGPLTPASGNPARFRFVPVVAGTWEFEDRVSGATGALTAR